MPTFEASRSEETSHADIAWATMHALYMSHWQAPTAPIPVLWSFLMSKRRNRRPSFNPTPPVVATQQSGGEAIEAFTFGEPVPVLSQREVFDYLESMHNGRWYEPPLSSMGCRGSIGPGCIMPLPSR